MQTMLDLGCKEDLQRVIAHLLVGNLVILRCKKQNVVIKSSAETEFQVMAHGICELLWLKIILNNPGLKE